MSDRLARSLAAASDRDAWLALFALAFVVAVLRDPGALLLPRLPVDDGILFQHFYGPSAAAPLFFHNGYVSLVPDLVGFAAARLPTPSIPFALALFPLLLTAVVPAETLRVLRGFAVPRIPARGFGLALVALPLGSTHVISSTMFAYCSLLYLALLWSIDHLRADARTGRAWWVLAPLCVASHPLSVVVLPCYGVALLRSPGRVTGLRLAWVTAAVGIYAALGIESAGLRLPDATVFWIAWSTLATRVVFELFCGGWLRALLSASTALSFVPLAVGSAGILALAALLAWHWRRLERDARVALGIALALVGGLTFLVVVARWGEPGAALGDYVYGRRYVHVQHLLLATASFSLLGRSLAVLRRSTLLWLVAGWLVALNATDAFYFSQADAEGREVRTWIAELQAAEQRAASDPSLRERHRLDRGEWSVEVEVRGASAR